MAHLEELYTNIKQREQTIKDSFEKKRNSKQSKVAEDKLLGKLRKRIETVFSAL